METSPGPARARPHQREPRFDRARPAEGFAWNPHGAQAELAADSYQQSEDGRMNVHVRLRVGMIERQARLRETLELRADLRGELRARARAEEEAHARAY